MAIPERTTRAREQACRRAAERTGRKVIKARDGSGYMVVNIRKGRVEGQRLTIDKLEELFS